MNIELEQVFGSQSSSVVPLKSKNGSSVLKDPGGVT